MRKEKNEEDKGGAAETRACPRAFSGLSQPVLEPVPADEAYPSRRDDDTGGWGTVPVPSAGAEWERRPRPSFRRYVTTILLFTTRLISSFDDD
jgi:hypothetical protein